MAFRTYLLLLLSLGILHYSSCAQTNSDGAELYVALCQNCHGDKGQGLAALYPPLAGADYLQSTGVDVACIIRNGIEGPIKVNGKEFNQPMAGFKTLTEAEITNLLNYIFNSWGSEREYFTIGEIKESLEKCTQ